MSSETIYQLIDRRNNGAVVGVYKDKIRARRARDRKDSEYGACRYHINVIINEVQNELAI